MICQLWDATEALGTGLPYNNHAQFYSWRGCVFFSAAKRGNAIELHISSKKSGKRLLRQAAHFICEYLRMTHPWCKAFLACVKMKSVKNLCIHCGFNSAGFIYEKGEVFVKWVA